MQPGEVLRADVNLIAWMELEIIERYANTCIVPDSVFEYEVWGTGTKIKTPRK